MQTPISQGVTTIPSTAQVLEQWSSGYSQTVALSHNDPLTLVPTVHRIDHCDATAYIPGSYETQIRWNARFPPFRRMIYPAYAKRLCVCVDAQCNSFDLDFPLC